MSLRWLLCVLVLLGSTSISYATSLTFVRDLFTTSTPGASASHTIQFTATHAIPAGGIIVLTPEPGAFTIPASLDYSSVDMAVSVAGGAYSDRDLAAIASPTTDGVTIVSGTNGSITLRLNSTTGIGSGDNVRITIGTIASYGALGSSAIVNPTPVGSYRVAITTATAAGIPIDSAGAMVAVVPPVTLQGSLSVVRPIRFNGLPSGIIAAGNTTVELSLETLDYASCRYATSSNVLYSAMTGTFSPNYSASFSTIVTGLADATTYTYYVRCINGLGNPNDDDYPISFTLGPTPSSNTSISNTGNPGVTENVNLGPGGIGSVPNGSALLYLASVTLSGWTIPLSTVSVLQDGVVGTTANADALGSFTAKLSGIERGAYTFETYTRDSERNQSSSYASTLTLGSGTNNEISSIVIAPTLVLAQSQVPSGATAELHGEGIPNARIEIAVRLQSNATTSSETYSYVATSTPAGAWRASIDTGSFNTGIYVVSARSIRSSQEKSDFGAPVFLGVGTTPRASGTSRSDINGDNKVNLVDFSILLSNWGTATAASDLNSDGTVNLADFSIMLFNWTG